MKSKTSKPCVVILHEGGLDDIRNCHADVQLRNVKEKGRLERTKRCIALPPNVCLLFTSPCLFLEKTKKK